MNYKAHKLPKTLTGIPKCDVPVSPMLLDNGMPQVMIAIQVYNNNDIMSVAGNLRLTPIEARRLGQALIDNAFIAEGMQKSSVAPKITADEKDTQDYG